MFVIAVTILAAHPSGDLGICRLLRLQSQTDVEFEELGHNKLGTSFRRFGFDSVVSVV